MGALGYIGYGKIYKKEATKDITKIEEDNPQEKSKDKKEEISNEKTNITSVINKRLYSVNSDLNQQRYYLLMMLFMMQIKTF